MFAASSFHWIDPKVRFTKSASILRKTGALAVFTNKHVRKDEGFFARVQDLYRMHAPSMERIANERKRLWVEPVVGEDLFNESIVKKYPWVAEYSAEDYIALLGTYSDHLSLLEDERLSLFEHIAKLIQEEYSGVVRKYYETVLTLKTVRPNKAL